MELKRLSSTLELNRLTDDQLLDMRFCDLSLSIEGTPLARRAASALRRARSARALLQASHLVVRGMVHA